MVRILIGKKEREMMLSNYTYTLEVVRRLLRKED